MDRRALRNKKSKSRSARPYDRPNQGILGKVASKVKGLFNPSWISSVSQWISPSEEQTSSPNTPEEESADEDVAPQTSSITSTSRGSKRPRLRLSPTLNEETQTWLETPPSSSLFSQSSHLPSTVTQNILVENKESSVIMNGDDHSENSEGSASTSGCSSLVSSHKERSNCLGPSSLRLSNDRILANLRGKNTINLKNRRDISSRKEGLSPNVNTSRMSTWSGSAGFSPTSNFLRRPPSVADANQPSFNVSAFATPSKVSPQVEKKVSSPFYQGRTTFGGASSSRRMPVSTAPYQVERPPRNQIKIRTNQSEDSLEGMSSAAKRILLTLEKMSSPVTDAKKMPNTNRSPVDLSLYLRPPKHRSNVVSTPVGTLKGPPIANISTISKLATLKSCRVKRFHNSTMESLPVPSLEKKKVIPDTSTQSDIFQIAKDKGGGKITNKLNQQHQKRVASSSLEQLEVSLPNVPLPITSLPTFSFGPKIDKKIDDNKVGSDFVFSSPIEVLPKATLIPIHKNVAISNFESYAQNSKNSSSSPEKQLFTFSSPIQHEVPSSISSTNFATAAATWECSSCWVRNSINETICLACTSARISSRAVELKSSLSTPSTKPLSGLFGSNLKTPSLTWMCDACWVSNPLKEVKCLACEAPKQELKISTPVICSAVPSIKASTTPSSKSTGSSTWECNECWVRNAEKDSKCLACETPKPGAKVSSTSTSSGSFVLTGSGFKIPEFTSTSSQYITFGGAKLPSVLSELEKDKPSGKKNLSDVFANKLSETSNTSTSSPQTSSDMMKKTVSNLKNTNSDTPRINGPIIVSLDTKKTSAAEGFSFCSGKDKTNVTSGFSFKSNTTSAETSSGTPLFGLKLLSTGTPTSNWECDTCLVRNSSDKLKCSACETLRPSKGNMTGLKDPESFKFNSPLQSSPITFKFNSLPSTSQTATTATSFVFGSTTSSTSSFLTPVSSTVSNVTKTSEEPKMTSLIEPSIPKPSVPEYKFDTPKIPSLDATKNTNISIVDLKNEKSDKSSFSALPVSKSSNEGSTTSIMSSSIGSMFKIIPSEGSTGFSTTASVENKWPLSLPTKVETSTAANPLLTESKLVSENVQPSQSKDVPVGGFNFKAPSSTSAIFGGFSTPTSKIDNKDASKSDSLAPSSELKSEGFVAEKKTDSPFVLNTSSSLSSVFTLPTSPLFKTTDKLNAPKSTETPLMKNILTSSTVSTATTAPFNFSCAPIPLSSLANNPTTQSNLSLTSGSSQPVSISQSQEVKKTLNPVAPFTAATTSSTFSFGSSVATTTQSSPSSGFSFFPSTAANTPASSSSSLFVFGGASSSTAQTSKPGGFVFKGLNEEKPNPASSNSLNFNVPTTTTVASPVFKFNNAPSGNFIFGAVKSEPGTVSTPSSNFTFGSGKAVPPTLSSIPPPGFPTNPSTTPFQFGGQSTGSSAPVAPTPAVAPAFGASTFTFGKSEATNQLPTTQASTSGFGVSAMQPMFGATAPNFAKAEKPAFNFGIPQGSNTSSVFQFGEKKQAQSAQQIPASRFPRFPSFPPQEAPASVPNSFASQFSFNATPTFNFGATATQAGPFQFAASSESQSSSAPRKIRKAVRRVPRKE